jgi:hypothetical protein
MSVLIGLAKDPAADERVRSVCTMAVLDRGGVMPIDKPEYERERDEFDSDKYTPEELDEIERALLLALDPARARRERGEEAQEVIPLGAR